MKEIITDRKTAAINSSSPEIAKDHHLLVNLTTKHRPITITSANGIKANPKQGLYFQTSCIKYIP